METRSETFVGPTGIRRTRFVRHSGEASPADDEKVYRGFCAFGIETEDEFHDRMFELPPLEAAIYEMEFELLRQG